ncbi:helix-turn-helix transcriptional regulator [Microaceticoccus formicicus]|uniref:helix-turn-helix transcriptional regulator n=1 Tax=Microaceticoccus formicicus TaxID=3118105 RepID=UPI003CD04A46|nr:AraC family transcriptional regulator [Peptoniphilaceae bacterium AMB_02]
MYKTEIAFVEAVREKNHEDAVRHFENIFKSLLNFYETNQRAVKNHLINLNGILYKSYKDDTDLEKVFQKRSEINEVIEKAEDINDLRNNCLKMISEYIELFNGDTIKTNNNTVNEAINFMKEHLHEDLSLGVVANKIHISKSYLSSLLAKHTKSSFPELMTEMRINNAKYLLKNTNNSILDISYKCGYNSQSYFCSTFKKVTGQTPTDYREIDHI